MLNSISISHVFVFDQDEALEFYVGKLGLEVSGDIDLGFMRWLTVRVAGQPGRDILLEKAGPPSIDEATAEQVRALIAKGASGFTVGFTTADCRKTYETLLAKGVGFTQEPVEQSYGTDIGIRVRSATTSASCSPRQCRRLKRDEVYHAAHPSWQEVTFE